jgi:hypothetical protein
MSMNQFNVHIIYKSQINNMNMKLIPTHYYLKMYYVLTFWKIYEVK